jgi:hypothetical protein
LLASGKKKNSPAKTHALQHRIITGIQEVAVGPINPILPVRWLWLGHGVEKAA